ncbi:MAG TPA: hypothetical protein VFZ73_09110 [Gemmatimonadaceae bacterium]
MSVRDSLYTVLESRHVRVYQETRFLSAHAQVRQELCMMDRQHLPYGLQLNDNAVFNEQVEPKGCLESDTFECHGHWDFGLHIEALPNEHVVKANAISTFEEARSEERMDAHSRTYDLGRDSFVFHNGDLVYARHVAVTPELEWSV